MRCKFLGMRKINYRISFPRDVVYYHHYSFYIRPGFFLKEVSNTKTSKAWPKNLLNYQLKSTVACFSATPFTQCNSEPSFRFLHFLPFLFISTFSLNTTSYFYPRLSRNRDFPFMCATGLLSQILHKGLTEVNLKTKDGPKGSNWVTEAVTKMPEDKHILLVLWLPYHGLSGLLSAVKFCFWPSYPWNACSFTRFWCSSELLRLTQLRLPELRRN